MSFYDIFISGAVSAIKINQLCLFSTKPQKSNCHCYTLSRDHSLENSNCADENNIFNDLSLSLFKPCGQCFLSSVFTEESQGKTDQGLNSEQQFDERTNFADRCYNCFDYYSVSEELACEEEEERFTACLFDCDLEKEEITNNFQSWQEWSMLIRRLPTPSTGTKCPES